MHLIMLKDLLLVFVGVQELIARVVILVAGLIFIMHILLDLLLVNKVHI